MMSFTLLFIFIALVGLLWKLEAHPYFGRWFRILPLPFWCYMIPMLGTTIGWLSAENPIYPFLSQQLLPVCLVLLLIGTDLKALIRLGPLATGLMLIGAVGTITGGLVSFGLYHRWLPEGTWAGVGALSASWIGGSANLIAVKEALRAPDSVIAPIIVVDAVVAYSWMAFLIWGSSQQERWTRIIQGHREGVGGGFAVRGRPQRGRPLESSASLSSFPERVKKRGNQIRARSASDAGSPPPAPSQGFIIGIAISLLVSMMAQFLSSRMPTLGAVISASTWTVLIVTTAALALSLTPLNKLGQLGISKVGTFLLFVLLASIGARANLQAIFKTPVFLLLGATWILIHGACLILGGYLLKAPLGLMAAASQANIGGPISAPIVGATYHPSWPGSACSWRSWATSWEPT